MKIFLDGAAGYLGSAILRRLAPAGSYYLGANADAPAMADIAAAIAGTRGLGGRVAVEPEEATRDRLGPLTDALLLSQQVDATHARELGWRSSGPSLLDELSSGSYAQAAVQA